MLANDERASGCFCGLLAAMDPAAFLFDIGNVIIRFDFGVAARRIEDCCAVPVDEILSTIEPLAVPFEKGQLSVEEFVATSTERIGFSGSADEFIEAFADIFTLNQPIADLIADLDAAGHPLYLLSNTNGIHEPFFTREWAEIFDRFDAAVYSHKVGLMKPDPDIFKTAIWRLRIVPEQTVYIDDRPENVEAGGRMGFKAIQYDPDDHASFAEAVRPFLT